MAFYLLMGVVIVVGMAWYTAYDIIDRWVKQSRSKRGKRENEG